MVRRRYGIRIVRPLPKENRNERRHSFVLPSNPGDARGSVSPTMLSGVPRLRLLSPRESEIARLVAEGKSNRAIAGELALSARTVEHHLQSVFAKLDVNSRAELMVAVLRGALPTNVHTLPERPVDNNLPLQLSSFIGRESDLAELKLLLTLRRLLTITGSGGIGKTRAALQLGAAMVGSLPDGVWFVELAPLSDGSLVASAVARALGAQESDSRPALETLVVFLRKKTLLLVLDNCEHVVAEAASVTNAVLRGCPNVRILATSRERLRVCGEQTYRLPSLGVPSTTRRLGADDAAAYGAIALFAARARNVVIDSH
jgi:DNA-binding CsgD family transcriptional regulator